MKYLVGIPCLYGAGHTKEAIESVVNKPGVDLLLIDNGAEQSVKEVLHSYSNRLNVKIIINPVNIYVNPAWNQILNHFLNNKYDYLLIMNSDLILHKDWKNILDAYLNE
jgi:GT2 family glycosyltransferase